MRHIALPRRSRHSFHEDEPESLVRLQEAHWLPLVAWVNERFGTDVQVFRDLLGNKQSQLSHDKLGAVLDAYDPWQLAGASASMLQALTWQPSSARS